MAKLTKTMAAKEWQSSICVLVLDYQSPFRGVHNSSKFCGEDEVDVQRSGQYLHADRRLYQEKQELESNNNKGEWMNYRIPTHGVKVFVKPITKESLLNVSFCWLCYDLRYISMQNCYIKVYTFWKQNTQSKRDYIDRYITWQVNSMK